MNLYDMAGAVWMIGIMVLFAAWTILTKARDGEEPFSTAIIPVWPIVVAAIVALIVIVVPFEAATDWAAGLIRHDDYGGSNLLVPSEAPKETT